MSLRYISDRTQHLAMHNTNTDDQTILKASPERAKHCNMSFQINLQDLSSSVVRDGSTKWIKT